ncbi:hypothetical protein [Ectobacillus panaciterrae]|uniref:hypothetical protein n=1 Tax=Ectobacillus panaciterrae TaxID=363872 RepID=UPI000407F1D9|nr:hypothetical protein [Ectobacillus panaciterrae]
MITKYTIEYVYKKAKKGLRGEGKQVKGELLILAESRENAMRAAEIKLLSKLRSKRSFSITALHKSSLFD